MPMKVLEFLLTDQQALLEDDRAVSEKHEDDAGDDSCRA
jgi:hypothetical protein